VQNCTRRMKNVFEQNFTHIFKKTSTASIATLYTFFFVSFIDSSMMNSQMCKQNKPFKIIFVLQGHFNALTNH